MMLKRPTLPVASPVARALAEYDLALSPKSDHFPVGIAASHIRIALDDDYHPLTSERTNTVSQQMAKANRSPGANTTEEFDELTDLMSRGLERMLKQVRGVVVPYCKQVKERFDRVTEDTRVPQIEVKPFVYHEIHSDPTLTTHVLEQYSQLRQKDSYRTFIMSRPSLETLIEWLQANKHVDAETTFQWITSLPNHDEELAVTWAELFGERRELYVTDLSMASRGRLPFTTDQLLIAYLLTAYLCHEPQDVTGESVSIDEWESTLGRLHNLFGGLLAQAYEFRAKSRQRQRVVFRYDVEEGGPAEAICVWANGDIYADWLEQGGSVEVLLGAATEAPTRMHAKDLDAVKNDLVKRWNRRHYLLKQTAMDRYLSRRRDILRLQLMYGISDEGESEVAGALPEIGYQELSHRVNAELKALRDEDFDDVWRTITALVCNVYYPNTPYKEFLSEMDRTAKLYPDMPARELATMATIEMTAQWLAKQIKSEPYSQDIREREDPLPNPAEEPERGEDVQEEQADVTTEEEEKADEEVNEDEGTVSA